jgi:hypothetical protein
MKENIIVKIDKQLKKCVKKEITIGVNEQFYKKFNKAIKVANDL